MNIIFVGGGISSRSAILKLYKKHSVILVDREINNINFEKNEIEFSNTTYSYDYLVIGDYTTYDNIKDKKIQKIFEKYNLTLSTGKILTDAYFSLSNLIEASNVFFINQSLGFFVKYKKPFNQNFSFQLGRFVAQNILRQIKNKNWKHFKPRHFNLFFPSLMKLYLNKSNKKIITYL